MAGCSSAGVTIEIHRLVVARSSSRQQSTAERISVAPLLIARDDGAGTSPMAGDGITAQGCNGADVGLFTLNSQPVRAARRRTGYSSREWFCWQPSSTERFAALRSKFILIHWQLRDKPFYESSAFSLVYAIMYSFID